MLSSLFVITATKLCPKIQEEVRQFSNLEAMLEVSAVRFRMLKGVKCTILVTNIFVLRITSERIKQDRNKKILSFLQIRED
jgi:hypothetical protein